MYNWDGKETECYRLYVTEKRSIDEVMEYWEQRGFTPSKRVFQTQFKRWGFPSKQNPAHKNPVLTARVKELWEQNSTQKEMLEILQEEGFQINDRELIRVRLRLGLMLRERAVKNGKRKEEDDGAGPKQSAAKKKKTVAKKQKVVPGRGLINQLGNAILADTSSEDESSVEEPRGEGEAEGEAQEEQPQQQADVPPTTETEQAPLDPAEILRRQLRHQQLQIESDEKWRTRKRRRRTRGWAGLPADAPGEPPRFPSETTLDESKAYLTLDNALYREVREQFQAICEEEGVIKKTVAGPEKWAQIVQRLIRQNAHLSKVCQVEPDILQNNDTMWRPKTYIALSLDVICMDVTKRLRTMDTRMTIPQAKNALGLNPQQARQVRIIFAAKLKENHFTNKYEAGDQRWAELKQVWVQESELLTAAFVQGEADPNYNEKLKAVEALARDVMKRERQEFTQKNPSDKKQARQGPGPGPAPPTVAPHVSSAHLRSRQSSTRDQSTTLQSTSTLPTISASVDLQIDPSLLLAASDAAIIPGTSYESSDRHQLMPQQSHQHQNASQSNYLTQNQSFYPNIPTGPSHTIPSHMPNSTSTSTSAPLPIYFRLHPQSMTPLPSKTVWLSILHAPSVIEIRNLAIREHPGTEVMKLEGLITYNRGQGQGEREILVVVEDDQELGAYFQHVGSGKATFVVLLSMSSGVGGGGGYV